MPSKSVLTNNNTAKPYTTEIDVTAKVRNRQKLATSNSVFIRNCKASPENVDPSKFISRIHALERTLVAKEIKRSTTIQQVPWMIEDKKA